MRVLLTGGTGFIGSAVLRALRGHDVLAVVRSDDSARAVTDAGATAVVGDLTDVGWLTGVLRDTDGAVHLASLGPDGDDAVIAAVLAAYAGTTKPFVYTGGAWTWGSGDAITEEQPQNPPALTAWRVERQERVLTSGLQASLVSPGIVYGYGQGIPAATIVNGPRTAGGALRLIGDGRQHWSTVHVDDLADLYVRVLEKAPGGRAYIGDDGANPTVREIASAVAGEVVAESADETRERLGAAYADALLLDQRAGELRARTELGWQPSRPGILKDITS